MKLVQLAVILMASIGLAKADTIEFTLGTTGTITGNVLTGVVVSGVHVTKIENLTTLASSTNGGSGWNLSSFTSGAAFLGGLLIPNVVAQASYNAGNSVNLGAASLPLSTVGAILQFQPTTPNLLPAAILPGTFTLNLVLPQLAMLTAGPGLTGNVTVNKATFVFAGSLNFATGAVSGTPVFQPGQSVLQAVPEPASMAMMGLGLAGFGLLRLRRRKAN